MTLLTRESGDLTSRMSQNQGPSANAVQSYIFHGFNRGSGTAVNTSGNTYYWVGFGQTGGDGGFI